MVCCRLETLHTCMECSKVLRLHGVSFGRTAVRHYAQYAAGLTSMQLRWYKQACVRARLVSLTGFFAAFKSRIASLYW